MPVTPRVSVVVSTFNRATLLEQSLASVFAQSYEDYELIVADDGSTDGTQDLLASYGQRVRPVLLDHVGEPESVRAAGAALAKGDYLAFLDDDDLWEPDYLRRHAERLDQEQELGFTYCDIRFILPDGTLSEPKLLPRHKRADRFFDEVLAGWSIYPSMHVVRRQLFEALGYPGGTSTKLDDFAFLVRLAHAAKAGFVPEALAQIRLHSANLRWRREVLGYEKAAQALETLLASYSLSISRKLRARVTIARYHAHAGLIRLSSGDRVGAQESFRKSLTWNPLQRQAWLALGRILGERLA